MLLLILHNERIRKLRYRFCNKNTSSPLAMVSLENHSVLEIMIFVSQVGTVAHKTFSYSEAAYSCSLQAR
jgi:hypothetical protein